MQPANFYRKAKKFWKVNFWLFFLSFHFFSAQEQGLGLHGGISGYTGDLSKIPFQKPAESLGIFYYILEKNERFLGLLNMSYFRFEATDKVQKNSFQQLRGLFVNTKILELSLKSHFHFLPFSAKKKDQNYPFTPYLQLGLSFLYFEPTGPLKNGKTDNLIDFDVENADWTPVSFGITTGIGLKMRLFQQGVLGLEYGLGLPYSLYLDGIVARGHRAGFDLWHQIQVFFFYRLGDLHKKNCNCK